MRKILLSLHYLLAIPVIAVAAMVGASVLGAGMMLIPAVGVAVAMSLAATGAVWETREGT